MVQHELGNRVTYDECIMTFRSRNLTSDRYLEVSLGLGNGEDFAIATDPATSDTGFEALRSSHMAHGGSGELDLHFGMATTGIGLGLSEIPGFEARDGDDDRAIFDQDSDSFGVTDDSFREG
ncbi:hypothetical protein MMC28_002896 [Mycoblastus sanguinarius]|nr:hypothetical protein [Mycoblastus sanguinarius]